MKVVVLGANGQLGSEFAKFLKNKRDIKLFLLTHKELDIKNIELLYEKFSRISPDVVINCAAYTNVEKAEKEQDKAFLVNAIGAKNAAIAAYKYNAKIVYFSTDYVFDGQKKSPYTEFDRTNPISVYGLSKLEGEILTKEVNPNHLILRISWLYGKNGKNFLRTINKVAKSNKILKIVSDQIGTPTYTSDVVKQTWFLIKKDVSGLYHSSNEGKTTWFEFAKKFFELTNLNVEILPIKASEFKALAKRPEYSVLDNYLLKLEGLNIMRKWEKALEDFISNEWEE